MTTDAAATTGFVDLRRGRMSYRSAGAGPTVVALHGWPGFSWDWEIVIENAAPFAHIVAPDFFGFGDSDTPPDTAGAADEDVFAADIIDLLDRLNVQRAVVAGYDIGSAVAPAVARLAPDRVTGLLLLNPTHPRIRNRNQTPELAESWYQYFHLLPLAPALLDGHADALRLYLGHFYDHWSGQTKITKKELDTVVAAYSRPGGFASSIAWYRARIARRRRAPQPPPPLPTRTLALWGDSDPMRPLAHRDGFEEAFPNSQSQLLANVGHFVPREAPEAVTASLSTLVADP